MKILLVEDNLAQAESLEMVLKRAGHVVLLAGNGEQAIAQVEVHGRNESIDAAIIDLLMPGMGGRELLSYLRGKRTTADIPVVITTGLPHDDSRLEGIDGSSDPRLTILQKPYDLKVLGKALGVEL